MEFIQRNIFCPFYKGFPLTKNILNKVLQEFGNSVYFCKKKEQQQQQICILFFHHKILLKTKINCFSTTVCKNSFNSVRFS